MLIKYIYLIVFCLSFTILRAQITIYQQHLPSVNDTIHYKVGFLTNLNPDETGTNYVWDFSNVQVTTTRADTIISVSQTPIVYNVVFNFLIANQAYINQNPPSLATGLTISDYYDFFKKASGYYRKAGFGATINGVQTPVKYDNPELFFKLPLTYGTSDSSISNYGLDIPNYGHYGQTIKRKHIADGWGTIITPFGTFPSIRVKHTIDIKDTIYSSQFGFGYTINRPTEYEYYWLTNAGIKSYAAKVYRQGIANIIEFYYDPTTNIHTNYCNDIIVYPNPANDIIFIETPFESSVLNMYNSLNQIVVQEKLFKGKNIINTAHLKSGIYIINIKNAKNVYFFKIVVCK